MGDQKKRPVVCCVIIAVLLEEESVANTGASTILAKLFCSVIVIY